MPGRSADTTAGRLWTPKETVTVTARPQQPRTTADRRTRLRRRVRRPTRVVTIALTAVLLSSTGLPAAESASATQSVGPPGIDVASWQHPLGAPIDWAAVAGSDAKFAIIKATQGTGYTNPYYASDWSGALAHGLIVGAYDYADLAHSPLGEARHFLQVTGVRAFGSDTLAPVLDLEQSAGRSPAQVSAWALAWLRAVQRATGRTPIFYSNRDFITRRMSPDPALARYPLWFASYAGAVPQHGPAPWSDWTFWQYTRTARTPGIDSLVDRSQLCGDEGTLRRLGLT